MRVLVLATMLLALSLCPASAQEEGKPPAPAPPTDQKAGKVPSQLDQNSQQTRNRPPDRDQSRVGDREMDRDWRIHRDDDRGRYERESGRDWRMRDRETVHAKPVALNDGSAPAKAPHSSDGQCCGLMCVTALPATLVDVAKPSVPKAVREAESYRKLTDNAPPQRYRPPIS